MRLWIGYLGHGEGKGRSDRRFAHAGMDRRDLVGGQLQALRQLLEEVSFGLGVDGDGHQRGGIDLCRRRGAGVADQRRDIQRRVQLGAYKG